MAYIVIQGSKGFVSLVEKGRVKNPDGTSSVRTIRGICGLGNMRKEEYIKYQDWAHSFKDQEERKAMVLSSGRAIAIKERAVTGTALLEQRKTTVKKEKKEKPIKTKHFRKGLPVSKLAGYRGKTHTEIMIERKKEQEYEEKVCLYLEKHPRKTEKWVTKRYFKEGMGK